MWDAAGDIAWEHKGAGEEHIETVGSRRLVQSENFVAGNVGVGEGVVVVEGGYRADWIGKAAVSDKIAEDIAAVGVGIGVGMIENEVGTMKLVSTTPAEPPAGGTVE